MVPINKSITFSGLKNLELAFMAEVNNPRENILSLTFIDTKKESGKTFKLGFEFEMSPKQVTRWFCKGEFDNGKIDKKTMEREKNVDPISLEELYDQIIDEVEEIYSKWLEDE
ncbi:hypothetical protein QWY93_14275 [Echinicola jeungdonensis]|uniref:Uncharacterized protein n=1 Tax=Echinicola jeungdonensis TaxID=709343 RepID=A0ABV5JAB1_9BACT|nr:hypothetical protein [Echinicola jeungdonensis]MDN3670485.1 hypothetical protein [Echinicola jeungdonensis]